MGVLVVMNDSIHLARFIQKSDSQLMGAFTSHPGPIGQMRQGRPHFYFSPPAADELVTGCDDFSRLTLQHLQDKVYIWTVAVGMKEVPEALLADCQGLILAAPGTGSLPGSMIEQLSPKWTSQMTIVITSRCATGNNHDDHHYRGSREKYEGRGFVLAGYEHLTALQARLVLMLRLSARAAAAAADQSEA